MRETLIRRCVVLTGSVGLFAGTAAAQGYDPAAARMPNQTVYFETGGGVGQLALNFDRKLNDWATLRIGYGQWLVLGRLGTLEFGDQPSRRRSIKHASLVPMTINLVPRIRPGSMHRVELSAGIVSGHRSERADEWGNPGSNGEFRALTAMVGYRVMYRPAVLRLGMYYSATQHGDFTQAGFRPAVSAGYQF
jgi:hypothetical protein